MTYYFQLQFNMLNRSLIDFGLRPVVGYLLIAVAFMILSLFLFKQTEMAQYLYILLAIVLLLNKAKSGETTF